MCESSDVSVDEHCVATLRGNNYDVVDVFVEIFCYFCMHLDTVQRGTRRIYHNPDVKDIDAGNKGAPSRFGT